MKLRARLSGSIATFAALLAGCGMMEGDFAAYSGSPGGEFGATQGGVQDMTLARSLVEEGRVPPAEAFLPEAMFSEHDLPLTGAPCDTLLCLRGAIGVAPDADGNPAAWVQIGMSSTIDPETFERPTQTLVATVDVSGSMGWGYPNETSAGEISRTLLHALADRLGERDRFALVTFGSTSRVALPLTSAADQDRIHAAIDDLGEGGSTNMESGMRTAYPLAASAVGSTDAVRVMVLSDYNPNVGATTPGEFQRLALEGAEEGVGLTLFGLGLGLAPAVMSAMSEIHGGNAFSLVSTAEVAPLLEDSWPWMVSPIAYDLQVKLQTSSGFRLAGSYGFPGNDGETEASLEVATVFLSRRKGAMLVRLAPLEAGPFEAAAASLSLRYAGVDGTPLDESLDVRYEGQTLDEHGRWLPQPGLARTVALALLVSGMREAAEQYATDHAAAVATLEAARERFASDIAGLADEAMDAELEFADALLALMRAGA
ncbi:MAG: VWA domain-containing protein, partial [Deltaproteobacteria bacterium]|nr:VWA domain-containing protein [Deltaproteobacteria bacterium]